MSRTIRCTRYPRDAKWDLTRGEWEDQKRRIAEGDHVRTFASQITGISRTYIIVDREVFCFRDFEHYKKWKKKSFHVDGSSYWLSSVPKSFRKALNGKVKAKHKQVVRKAMKVEDPSDLHLDKPLRNAAYLYW